MITNAMTKAIKVANALGLTPGSWGRFLHRKSSEMMKSQAALKIIVMVTLLISDIDVFFLGVSIYEYWAAKFQIGLIAVFGMCGVYLGGVYFGAMQRFKLDATIIAYCEQGKHDSAFKSGLRREIDLKKWKDTIRNFEKLEKKRKLEKKDSGGDQQVVQASVRKDPELQKKLKAEQSIEQSKEDELMRDGLKDLMDALRYHKKKPHGVAILCDRLTCCGLCGKSFKTKTEENDKKLKSMAEKKETLEKKRHEREQTRLEKENGGRGAPREEYDEEEGPLTKYDEWKLKMSRFREMSVKELYQEHQMINTYLLEERSFIKNMLQVAHAVPLFRLMKFGWRTDIDPVDFAGILNANALYSFTLGFAQLGFSAYFLATHSSGLPPGCPKVRALIFPPVGDPLLGLVANATLTSPPPPSPPPPSPPLPPPIYSTSNGQLCEERTLLLAPTISIAISILSFILSFCNICLDFARRLHMQEIERLERDAYLEQVQMELEDFKSTSKDKREIEKAEVIAKYKPKEPKHTLDNPFKLTRDLMLIEAGYDAADLSYSSYASKRREDLEEATKNKNQEKMNKVSQNTFTKATSAVEVLMAQESVWDSWRPQDNAEGNDQDEDVKQKRETAKQELKDTYAKVQEAEKALQA